MRNTFKKQLARIHRAFGADIEIRFHCIKNKPPKLWAVRFLDPDEVNDESDEPDEQALNLLEWKRGYS